MKIYLPSSKDKGVFMSLLFLAGVFLLGMCVRVNDAVHGRFGKWLNQLMDWLIARQRR